MMPPMTSPKKVLASLKVVGYLDMTLNKKSDLNGIVISAVSHEGLAVTVNGKTAKLAIVLDNGEIVAIGDAVAREAEIIAVESYKNMIKGQGYLRVMSKPLH
jgi:hypothetical protein